ncbi:pentatricopeptide repeat-containing protein, chloroplastic [Cinnamomum micranthum f. kanehirae]|uniref:Pentatricopeptide repeat-containing protein, chloroplastic n=1 Tax=Cinnamomum micranthum f. kanehirae TaxID=337451 RepID=A0A3S3MHQ1_9MAGN|nr:pentatricopeptide repeat-containing protein, chloroplastic [Cinnamomum micranthum f. kanehirae]
MLIKALHICPQNSHTSSLPKAQPTFQRPHKSNPPLQISKLPQKHNHEISTLKEICRHGSLKQAFLSFNNTLSTHQNHTPQFPWEEAYSSLLELCAAQGAVPQGQQIHAHILTSNAGLDDGFLATKLLFMYGKCGLLSDAQRVFDEMTQRSVFAWNALIGVYASSGRPYEALEIYWAMRVAGIIYDACTLTVVLKACGMLKDLDHGTEIHGLAIKCGLVSFGFLVNSLISMYSKCGDFSRARQLFDLLPEREDVVTWNSVISAYSQNGQYFEALRQFREMQKAGVAMNTYTAVGVLQACTELSLARFGMEIHAALLRSGRKLDMFEANALVVMYARSGRIVDAVKMFHAMDEIDSVSWNSMLSGYVQNGFYNEALEFFYQMQELGHKPDQVSVISIVSASGRLGNVLNGMEIHAYAIKRGFDSDMQVGNTLIDMYVKCCCVKYAERIFYRMTDKDFISWTTMIAGYAQNHYYLEAIDLFRQVQREGMKVDPMMIGSVLHACGGLMCISYAAQIHCYAVRNGLFDLVLENSVLDIYGLCGKIKYASQLFKMIKNKDVVSWTSMISSYVRNGLANEALDMFRDMIEADIEIDMVAMMGILSAVASLSTLSKGKEIHGFLIRRCFVMDGPIISLLVDMYARCGTVDNCFKVFNMTRCDDLVLWTSMINACGMHGRGEEAVDLFRKMQQTSVKPDHITFLVLLYACSHSGLFDEGRIYLEIMKNEYQLEPWPDHYACVVDLLGRSDRLNEAYEFIKNIPIEPTAAVWCALLGACRVHSDNELGEFAARKLLELDSENPGNYVLASNVFAASKKWKDVEEVRMRMRVKGLKKNPACSWIEVGNKVHTFIARDRSHPQTLEIYSKLDDIISTLEKEAGYVAETRFVLHNVREDEKKKLLHGHSERLAIAFGLIATPKGTPIRITKNLRVCGDCHHFTKLVSKYFEREIVVRDANRFHHFISGLCSCGDFW